MMEWTRFAKVSDGGHVELVLPELREGEEVKVVIRRIGRPPHGGK